MKAQRIFLAGLTWLLATAVASPALAAHAPPDASVAPSEGPVLEVKQKDQTYRVRLQELRGGPVQVGDDLELRLLVPTGTSSTGGTVTEPGLMSKEPAASPGSGSALPNIPLAMWLLIVGLVAAVAALMLYFLVWVPHSRRRRLREAEEVIVSNDESRFEEAEQRLSQALISGLWKKDVATARFLLAYVRARMGRYADALAVLADAEQAGLMDPETTYLALWLRSRQGLHEQIEAFWTEYGNQVADMLDAKLIAAIAYLSLARQNWARRELQDAMRYFDQLRKLNCLVEEIPSGIDDHQAMLGIEALFNHDIDRAEKHFKGGVEAATRENRPTLHSELGLLLCEWRREERPNLDDRLGQLMDVLTKQAGEEATALADATCPHCGHEFRVRQGSAGKRVTCKSCRRSFLAAKAAPASGQAASDKKNVDKPVLLSEEDLLRRNSYLWHAVSLLFVWWRAAKGSGAPKGGIETLRKRAGKVSTLDPDMGDPYVLDGLILYYFASNEMERAAGADILRKAVDRDVSVPEVLNVLDREDRRQARRKNALNEYLADVRKYLADKGVPEEYRRELKARLERFERFRKMEDEGESMVVEEGETAPTIADLRERTELIRRRMATLVKPKLEAAAPEECKKLDGIINDMEKGTKSLAEGARQLQDKERDLLAVTGEFLLNEESTRAAKPTSKAIAEVKADRDGQEAGDDEDGEDPSEDGEPPPASPAGKRRRKE